MSISRSIILAAALVLAPRLASAQAWQLLNPKPTGNAFSGVSWTSTAAAWAVTTWGEVFQTTDGGGTWNGRPVSTGSQLNGVLFTTPARGWIYGAGVLLHTTDSGATWQTVNTGFGGTTFSDLAWVDALNGWLVGSGGLVLHTTDGGGTWVRQAAGATTQWLTGVAFGDARNGWACGNAGTVLHTTNAGTAWTKQTVPTTTAWIRDVAALSTQDVRIVGDGGRIYASSNSGGTWTIGTSGTPRNLQSVWFGDFNHGVAVGDGGTVRFTIDAGTTWNTPYVPYADNLTIVRAYSAQRWLCAGAAGRLLTSTDGGASWTGRSTGPSTEWLDASFPDSLYGWVCGRAGQLWRTTDGGATWNAVTTGTTHNLNALHFINRTTGWAVGDTMFVMKTVNGGTSWTTQTTLSAKYNLYDVRFTDANTGWICGGTGAYLLHTTNGGTSWAASYTNITGTVTLRKLAVTGPNVWAVGTGGVVYRTFNGGTTWISSPTGTSQPLYGVTLNSQLKAMVCGGAGTVLTTTDGGSTWQPLPVGTTQPLLDLQAIGDTIRLCGGSGALIRSTNYGGSWLFAQPSPTGNQFNALAMPTGRSAFAVGQNGCIYKSFQPLAAISTSRRILAFDSIAVGTCDTLPLTVYSVGDDSVRIDSVTLSTTVPVAIGAATTFPHTLRRGDSLALKIVYCPPDTGAIFSTLVITSSAPNSPDQIPVHGYAGTLGIALPDTLDFGRVAGGDQRDSTVTLANTGTIPLHIVSIAPEGADSALFAVTNVALPLDLGAGFSVQFLVTYSPLDSTPSHARLVCAFSRGAPRTMALIGNASASAVAGDAAPAASAWTLYPNPVAAGATVHIAGAWRGAVRITDVLGRTQWRGGPVADGAAAITLPALAPGAYVLELAGARGVARRLVIVRAP